MTWIGTYLLLGIMKWTKLESSGTFCCVFQFADKVIRHNPLLPGLPVLNHDRTDHNTSPIGALVHSNSSVIQLLLYDIITLPANTRPTWRSWAWQLAKLAWYDDVTWKPSTEDIAVWGTELALNRLLAHLASSSIRPSVEDFTVQGTGWSASLSLLYTEFQGRIQDMLKRGGAGGWYNPKIAQK